MSKAKQSFYEKRYDPRRKQVFVFGSNLAGIHGAGAALYARKWLGALQLIAEGPMPDEKIPSCYAIPTKDHNIKTLSITDIKPGVDRFRNFAILNPNLSFFITRIGCGLAGYVDSDIAPLFKESPSNCELPNGWEKEGIHQR